MFLLKYLLITFLIIYLLSRVGGFLFRSIFWMLGMRAMDKQMRHQQQQPRRRNGEEHIEYDTPKQSRQGKPSSKGGDYIDIDYEEVK